jgi:hypothetical protein
VSLGSLLRSEEAGRTRVALIESVGVWRDALIPGLSPLGTVSMMTSVGCISRM